MATRPRLRILLVDDSLELLRVMTQVLEQAGAYDVVGQALDGRDALELARTLRPDAVLVDFDMPGMSGEDTVRELKIILPATRVIVVSGHEDVEYALRSRTAGADGFTAKRRLVDDLPALLCARQEHAC